MATCTRCGREFSPSVGTCPACGGALGAGVDFTRVASKPTGRIVAPRFFIFTLVCLAIIVSILVSLAFGEYPTHDPQPTPLAFKIGVLVAAGISVIIAVRFAVSGVWLRNTDVVVRRISRTTSIPIDRVVEVADVALRRGIRIALVDDEGNHHVVPVEEAFIDLRYPDSPSSYQSKKDALARSLNIARVASDISSGGRVTVSQEPTAYGDPSDRLRQQFISGSVILVLILLINRDSSSFGWMVGIFAVGWVAYLIWYLRGR